jgi:hypothetical protein
MMKEHEAHPCFDTILWGGLPNPVTTSAGWGWVAGEPYHHPQRGFFPHHHHPFFLASSSFCLFVLGKMLDLQHQQLYNNPSHEGGSHILGPTLM